MIILGSDFQRSLALVTETRNETFGEPPYIGWLVFSESLISVIRIVAEATCMKV